jgi:ribonuclease D
MKWIDRQEDFDAAMTLISRHRAFGIDTEADSLHSYFDKVCLIQISIDEEDYVIDPLTPLDLSRLGELLADADVTKVFHGADYDLRILNRDFDFVVGGLVDTMVCGQLLGLQAFGLAALLKKYFDVELDKSYQRADWSQRPLTPAMMEYASLDTRYLIRLAAQLRMELEAKGRWSWAVEEFGRLEAIRFRNHDEEAEPFRRLKGLTQLDRRTLGIISKLYNWRDSIARKRDVPPFKVLGNETMIELAKARPESSSLLKRIRGMSRDAVARYSTEILAAIAEGRSMPDDQLPELAEAKPWRRDRDLERRIDRLKTIRDAKAKDLGIDSGVLAPKHVLSAVAAMRPSAVEQLHDIAAMRRWQIEVLGEELVRGVTSGS